MTTSSRHFLDGGGEMAVAIHGYDWSSNVLGPPEDWPPALKTAVGMALNSSFPKCIVWGPGLVTIYNDAFRPILGDKPDALGRSFREVWSEAWDTIGPIAERAYAGDATFIEDFPLTVDRHGYPEQAYFTFCYSPIRDENGEVRGMMDTVIETTGKVGAEKRTRLLNDELTHRIKNTLSVVSAIVSQTFRTAGSKEDMRTALMQRIDALAQAQSLISQSSLAGVAIGDVIEGALAPFRGEREQFELGGPSFVLPPKQSLSLALAINELATNATKYGALQVRAGKVRVSWTIGDRRSPDELYLSWEETGGPPVSKPSRRGFGSRIIEDVLAQDFQGRSQLLYAPQGIRYELTASMANLGIDTPSLSQTAGSTCRPAS